MTATTLSLFLYFFEVIYIYLYYIFFNRNASAITRYVVRYNSVKGFWGLRYEPLSDIDNTACYMELLRSEL